MIPFHSKIGQGRRTHFEKLVNWNGKKELIPVHLENNIFNFYLNREVKSTETNNVNDAAHYLAKNCQQPGNGVLRRTVSSRETGQAEQCARKSNENSESRCSTYC